MLKCIDFNPFSVMHVSFWKDYMVSTLHEFRGSLRVVLHHMESHVTCTIYGLKKRRQTAFESKTVLSQIWDERRKRVKCVHTQVWMTIPEQVIHQKKKGMWTCTAGWHLRAQLCRQLVALWNSKHTRYSSCITVHGFHPDLSRLWTLIRWSMP